MATDWIKEQSNVYNDLLKEGMLFTFTREVKGDYDPKSGFYKSSEVQTFTAPGIIQMKVSPFGRSYINVWMENKTILEGDKILMVSPRDYQPELEDSVNLNGEDFLVKAFTPLQPAAIDLLIYLVVRKA